MAKRQRAGLIATIGVAIAGIVIVVMGIMMMHRAAAIPPYRNVPGGNIKRGRQALIKYNCGSCHRIPGVEGANGTKGQSLGGFGYRTDIVGALANTPEDAVRWIRKPKSVYPDSAMPELDISEQEALDIVAYLYSLPP
jgi:cytochrome c